MKKTNHRKAFSLIELSIVILIIGIIIAGVTQSSRLVKKSRLQAAISLTQGAPVPTIDKLVGWYETSIQVNNFGKEKDNADTVTEWFDTSPASSLKRNLSIASSVSPALSACTPPKINLYDFNGGIPGVTFSLATDCLRYPSSYPLSGANYTIFLVEAKNSSTAIGNIISSTTAAGEFNIAYGSNTSITVTHNASTLTATNTSLGYGSVKTTRIHTFKFDGTNRSYWLNGGFTSDANISSAISIPSMTGLQVGLGNYAGSIGEIIIYSKALSDEERQSVEDYLSKKYGVLIS